MQRILLSPKMFMIFFKSLGRPVQLPVGVVLLHANHSGEYPHQQRLTVRTSLKKSASFHFLCTSCGPSSSILLLQDQRLVGFPPLRVNLLVGSHAHLVNIGQNLEKSRLKISVKNKNISFLSCCSAGLKELCTRCLETSSSATTCTRVRVRISSHYRCRDVYDAN